MKVADKDALRRREEPKSVQMSFELLGKTLGANGDSIGLGIVCNSVAVCRPQTNTLWCSPQLVQAATTSLVKTRQQFLAITGAHE